MEGKIMKNGTKIESIEKKKRGEKEYFRISLKIRELINIFTNCKLIQLINILSIQ